jgi:hypothetical protein
VLVCDAGALGYEGLLWAVVRSDELCRTAMLDVSDDVTEDIADRRAKQGEDDDNDDSDKNKYESVFYKTLTFFFRGE